MSPKDKGYTETVQKFAWLPTFMTSGDLVIFERYTEKRMWDYSSSNIWRSIGIWKWHIIERKRG